MEEETHELHGEEIPDVGEKDGDMDMAAADDDAIKEVEEMKKRLKVLEDEAAILQTSIIEADQVVKKETDARSIFVGNVDYACTPEEVQQHFQTCGTVHRVTILTDEFGHPKGYAYVEFVEVEARQHALQLNESEMHGRQLKVLPKRTNVPGLKQFRPFRPPYMYSPYGYGKVPRFRRSMRYYSPY